MGRKGEIILKLTCILRHISIAWPYPRNGWAIDKPIRSFFDLRKWMVCRWMIFLLINQNLISCLFVFFVSVTKKRIYWEWIWRDTTKVTYDKYMHLCDLWALPGVTVSRCFALATYKVSPEDVSPPSMAPSGTWPFLLWTHMRPVPHKTYIS